MSEVVLRKFPKEIGLVFSQIHTTLEEVSTLIGFRNPSIMPGSYSITPQLGSYLHQFSPLDIGITHHTRIWGAAMHIFFDEIGNNRRFKLLSNIQNMMRETH